MNSDEVILRRCKNARMNGSDGVVFNDGTCGAIYDAGDLLRFILGEEPLEFDEERDEDMEFEEP